MNGTIVVSRVDPQLFLILNYSCLMCGTLVETMVVAWVEEWLSHEWNIGCLMGETMVVSWVEP